MTVLSSNQTERLDALAEAYQEYQNERSEALARAKAKVERRLLPTRLRVAQEAYDLKQSGVPGTLIGTKVVGTRNYATYMDLINDGAKAEEIISRLSTGYLEESHDISDSPEARFEQGDDPDKFTVFLSAWGEDELSGGADFIRVDGEWLNADVDSEVGIYVERVLFLEGSDEELRGLFEREVPQ